MASLKEKILKRLMQQNSSEECKLREEWLSNLSGPMMVFVRLVSLLRRLQEKHMRALQQEAGCQGPRTARYKLCPQAMGIKGHPLVCGRCKQAEPAEPKTRLHMRCRRCLGSFPLRCASVGSSANIGEVRYCSRSCQQANWKDRRDFI